MNTISKTYGMFSVLAVLTIALFLSSFGTANAALTIAATSITTDGAYTVTSVAASTVNMFAANTSGVITIGGTAQTGNLVIGTSSGIMQMDLGVGTGATTVNIATGGTGANTVNIGTGAIGNLVTIGSVTAAASLDLLFGTGDFTIDGAAAGTITIGDTAQTGAVTIADSSDTLTLDIGTGEGATTIGIGTGTTNANTINIGTGAVANAITIGSVTALGGMRFYENTEAVTADNTVAVTETGTVYYLSGAASTTTLPAVGSSNGLSFRFVVSGSVTGNITISSAAGDDIEGALMVAGAIVDCNAADLVRFDATGENLGDWVTLRSNGTNWFVDGGGLTSAKLTCSG